MVIDTSALLAIVFNELNGSWVADRLENSLTAPRMSTVNFSEFLIIVRDKQPHEVDQIESAILSRGIRFVPPTVEHARIAAKARLTFPLNLGDCFAYALARDENCPLITLDRDFREVDLNVIMPK